MFSYTKTLRLIILQIYTCAIAHLLKYDYFVNIVNIL